MRIAFAPLRAATVTFSHYDYSPFAPKGAAAMSSPPYGGVRGGLLEGALVDYLAATTDVNALWQFAIFHFATTEVIDLLIFHF